MRFFKLHVGCLREWIPIQQAFQIPERLPLYQLGFRHIDDSLTPWIKDPDVKIGTDQGDDDERILIGWKFAPLGDRHQTQVIPIAMPQWWRNGFAALSGENLRYLMLHARDEQLSVGD